MSAEPETTGDHGRRRVVGFLGGIRLGRLFGIEIVADWSLILIFVLIAMDLGLGVLPSWHPDWSPGLIAGMALGTAVAFFASILVHELSHALVARQFDVPVPRITLFLFGGMAHMEGEPPSPMSEMAIAAIGPVVSIVIGVLTTLVGVSIAGPDVMTAEITGAPVQLLRTIGPAATLLLWLGPINVVLGLFNLVPGFPLDGGRVLRSILWAATGDLVKATRWASTAGRLVAWGLVAFGLLNVFEGDLGGLWLMLIGWFLHSAARASYQQLLVKQALAGVSVGALMGNVPEYMKSRLAGASFDDALSPTDPASEAMRRLVSTRGEALPVVEDGELRGILTLHDVLRYLDLLAPTSVGTG